MKLEEVVIYGILLLFCVLISFGLIRFAGGVNKQMELQNQKYKDACAGGDTTNCIVAVSKTQDRNLRDILWMSYRLKTGHDLPRPSL